MEQKEPVAPKPALPAELPSHDQSAETLTPTDEFMLAEYKNISQAHFELHTAFRQMFRFYLGIVAVPVTIFAFAYKDVSVTIESLPSVFVYILMLSGILGLLMFLSLVNIRFDIIFYTRTVNGTRNYFLERSKNNLSKFLLLPGNMRFPPYAENFKAYWWQFLLVALINSAYIVVPVRNLGGRWSFAFIAGALTFCLHCLAYFVLANQRNSDDERRLVELEKPPA